MKQFLESTGAWKKVLFFGAIAVLTVYLVTRPEPEPLAYTVSRGNLERTVAATGKIERADEISLAFQQTGAVKKILVDSGDNVKEGQLLAQLDLGTLNAEYREASANLLLAKIEKKKETLSQDQKSGNLSSDAQRAKQTLEALRSKLLSTDLEMSPVKPGATVGLAPIVSGIYTGSIEPEEAVIIKMRIYPSSSETGLAASYVIGSVAGSVELSARHSVAIGDTGLYLMLASTSTEGLSETDWTIDIPNTAASSYPTTLFQYREAKKNYEASLLSQSNTLDISRVSYNGLTVADAAVMRASAQLSRVGESIAARGIRAPFAGSIGRLSIKKGQQVTSSTDAIALLGGGGYVIKLKVPESVIGGVRVGDTVRVSVDAISDKIYNATVTATNTAETYVEGTPVYETTVLISDADDQIKSGMNATGTIVLDTLEDVITIPESAIDKTTGEPFVQRVTDKSDWSTAENPVIITGKGSNGFVAVTGIEEGSIVVLPESKTVPEKKK
jgi:HlyD family secretion protein